MRNFLKVAAAGCALVAAPAFGQTTTSPAQADLTVQAVVQEACDVSTATIDFGNLNTVAASTATDTTDISVTCTVGTDWTMSLDGGANPSGGLRRMAYTDASSVTHYIPYNLYEGTSTGTLWDTAHSTTTASATGSSETVSVFADIDSSAINVPAGSYSDTVTISVAF